MQLWEAGLHKRNAGLSMRPGDNCYLGMVTAQLSPVTVPSFDALRCFIPLALPYAWLYG